MDGLTPMQRRFCLEYLKDKNGTKAAIRAGYAKSGASTEAFRLLRNAEIRQFIRSAIEEQEARVKVDADRVINELSRIAFFDASILEDIANGKLALSELSADERAAISEYSKTRNEFGVQVKIKAHPKIKALEILAKHFNLFKEDEDERGGVSFTLSYPLKKKE